MTSHPRIYLSSQSPRRRELLKQIGVSFETLLLHSSPGLNMEVDESPRTGEAPGIYVQRICQDKVNAGRKVLRIRNLPPSRFWLRILVSVWMEKLSVNHKIVSRL